MTGDDFLLLVEHLIKHTTVKRNEPLLLLLDNHPSHLSVRVLGPAKENGAVLLFPTAYNSHTETFIHVHLWRFEDVCEQSVSCMVIKPSW
jgi:hypothetical protein